MSSDARRRRYIDQRKRATPKWADPVKIRSIYWRARYMREVLGYDVNVDHIVPLLSDEVCGLHCEDNLEIVHRRVNSKKSNHTWPDAWQEQLRIEGLDDGCLLSMRPPPVQTTLQFSSGPRFVYTMAEKWIHVQGVEALPDTRHVPEVQEGDAERVHEAHTKVEPEDPVS